MELTKLISIGFKPLDFGSLYCDDLDIKGYFERKKQEKILYCGFKPLHLYDCFEIKGLYFSDMYDHEVGFSIRAKKEYGKIYLSYSDWENSCSFLDNPPSHKDYAGFNNIKVINEQIALLTRNLVSVKYLTTPLSVIYLIESEFGYKIGLSSNPKSRMNMIKTLMPFDTKCIRNYIVKKVDVYNIEQLLHKEFDEKRINGEWFKLTVKDVSVIDYYFLTGVLDRSKTNTLAAIEHYKRVA